MGCGTVGSGFLKAYEQYEQKTVDLILVRNKTKYKHLKNEVTTDYKEILLSDPDVIVETIGGIQEAHDYVTQALKAGIHVVTANKDLLAEHGKTLFDLAYAHGVVLRYEAAVGGGIPIISNILSYYHEDDINSIEGILNGTSNYILSQMNKGLTFEKALADAKRNGFAEENPQSDVEGLDPARKISVLIQTAFKTFVRWQDIETYDISRLDDHWVEYCQKHDLNIRLMCKIVKDGEQIYAGVQPEILCKNHVGYTVNDEANYVSLYTKYCQESTLIGKGAGKCPTGYAVYRDFKQINTTPDLHLHLRGVKPLEDVGDWLITLDENSVNIDYETIDDHIGLVKNKKGSELQTFNIRHIKIRR